MRVSANLPEQISFLIKNPRGFTLINFLRKAIKGNPSGFTLIELMVVIAVMSVLSVFALANYNSLKESQNLKNASNDIQNLVRQAQSNAVIRLNCNGSPSGVNTGATWLIVFRTDASNVDLECQIGSYISAPIRTVNLPNSIKIDSITGSCLSVFPTTTVTVSYAPLLGQVSFSAANDPSSCIGGSSVTGLTVVVKNNNTTEPSSFKINKGGAVNGQ